MEYKMSAGRPKAGVEVGPVRNFTMVVPLLLYNAIRESAGLAEVSLAQWVREACVERLDAEDAFERAQALKSEKN
jgi:hypothetical protein